MKKRIVWNIDKNNILKKERNISFEKVAKKIKEGNIIDDIYHPNNKKYSNQRIFVIEIDEYIYLVPYVENESEIFFKNHLPK